MGAVGLQVCPPIFNIPSQDDLLDYFGELSDAIDIGIMVYHTHWMSGGRIEVDTIMKMADIEQVAAIKWSAPDGVDYSEMSKFSSIFSVIDNGAGPAICHKLGGRGYINLTAEAYPAHDLKVWDLLEAGQYDEAQALHDSVNEPLRVLDEKFAGRSGGQARLKKGIMALMGQSVGASRPPSKPMNECELGEVRDVLLGFGWPVEATASAAAVSMSG
jgi:4-hydroxy-tetrahydrodipicolinate synthase